MMKGLNILYNNNDKWSFFFKKGLYMYVCSCHIVPVNIKWKCQKPETLKPECYYYLKINNDKFLNCYVSVLLTNEILLFNHMQVMHK